MCVYIYIYLYTIYMYVYIYIYIYIYIHLRSPRQAEQAKRLIDQQAAQAPLT